MSVESAIQTAVQTVVKREDEQQFAKINGENLMFCEDAARRIRETIDKLDYAADYRIRVEHLESLHPHDAVAIVTKGLQGGLTP
jgi:GTP cyclohydrolase I